MKRRSLLQQLAFSATLLASAGALPGLARLMTPEARSDPRRHLRPPGALSSDDAFVAACIGCGLCGEICPPKCIRFHQRDGGSQVNTPFINPEEKACILCAKCMDVCPTKALTETPREKIDMGIAQIDRAACYPWVDKGICGACVSICPLGERAINFKMWNQYRPVVKTGCVGCGLCVEVCPHPSLPIRIVARELGTVARHTIS
ncbi:MAG: 4Fe-4S dicluster domain-containing protein [Gammaproteobacteria bacterium]|nr:MAG: 4Fe-4S dicluster domain-containing protein [Gammaproteobacteria bacterium]RTZ60408.1 MAG: 4Fe-4S dicluster domain-containing protein [Gammaproteobacteria bacterium]